MTLWQDYYTPTKKSEVLALLARHAPDGRVIAGGSDLMLELNKGLHAPPRLIDVARIPGLDRIYQDDRGTIHLGPLTTHSQVVGSALCVERAYPLAQACWSVGSPQIRNVGTVAGNLITGSPANDTITSLRALDARVTLTSARRGGRLLPLDEFFQGVRRTALAEDEILTDIAFQPLTDNERGIFLKLAWRRALAVAIVNVAVLIAFDGSRVARARIALGSVAPVVLRASEAEASLEGRSLSDQAIDRAAELVAGAVRPIDDVRASGAYRRQMASVLVRRALTRLGQGREREDWPTFLPRLWGTIDGRFSVFQDETVRHSPDSGRQPIETVINGHPYTIHGANDKTMLRMLREDAGLTGTKDGCAEGECGSCTILLDGIAVLSCLLPAPRAHRAKIETVEGLARNGQLSVLQRAFIDTGAVQCGYCTPGFLMSARALLGERPIPSREVIRYALSGNLCRCTGYYKIVNAVERAASQRRSASREARR